MTTFLNETPWNTEDLRRFILPLAEGLGLDTIAITILEPQPGVAREKQIVARITTRSPGARRHDTHARIEGVEVELLTPKRADVRTGALDRLSVVEDLKTTEALLTEDAVARVIHGFQTLHDRAADIKRGGTIDHYTMSRHLRGKCACKLPATQDTVIVRGDTTVKTHANRGQASITDVEHKLKKARESLSYSQRKAANARREVAKYEAREANAIEKIQKLEHRLLKLRAKESMSVPLAEHTSQ